jgi:ubiquinol-cytochrome c reductase cytochrome c subunit
VTTADAPELDAPPPSRRRRIAGFVIVLIALAVMGSLYAGLAPHGTAAGTDNTQIQQGRQLFLQGCATCHGLNGQGGVRAPSLIGVGAAAVDFQVGTGRMPLQQHGAEAPVHPVTYSQAEIEQMAAFVASLGPGPAIPTNLDYQSADTAFGGALFRTNCAQCHNFTGSGGALTYGKFAPTLSDATPKQIYEAMITGPENMPVFGDQQITPDQKLAIINYIRTLTTQPDPGGAALGRVGPVSEGVVGWLVGIGVLVLFTMWIGSRA